jgi:lipid-A-disaccharide synthase
VDGPTIFVAAGEPSGDAHGAALVRALRRRLPRARFVGMGGDRMAAEGVERLAVVEDLAVMGFGEVVGRLPYFARLKRRVWRHIERERVDLVIPIDYPGFNLRLAERASQLEIPTLYYIAPQVWAWHASRARKLARFADHVAVILPFEEEFFRSAGARVSFVGHPLLEAAPPEGSRAEWAARFGLDAERPILALFPGSRRQELRRHLALFSEAASLVTRARPEVQPVIAAAASLPGSLFAASEWPIVPGDSGLLHHATAALVKSGTTTLEAALARTPFVVAYRTSPLSYALARRLVRVPHIALANLVADARVVPEFIQDDATPAALCAALLPLLETSGERERMVEALGEVRRRLGQGGAVDRVAEIAISLLERGRARR